jgi:hypothetical protein
LADADSKTDMNVPSNLEFYRQIIELESNSSRHEITFKNLNHSEQRSLQAIAHSRKLKYEYHHGYARVFRNTPDLNVDSYVHTNLAFDGGAGLGMWSDVPIPLA